jgi:hypothetical protein
MNPISHDSYVSIAFKVGARLCAVRLEHGLHRNHGNDGCSLKTTMRVVDRPNVRIATLHIHTIKVCPKF